MADTTGQDVKRILARLVLVADVPPHALQG